MEGNGKLITFLRPFLVGLVAGPVGWAIFKPLARGAVKSSVLLAMEVKKLAEEAGEELRDVAAELSADIAAAKQRDK